MPLNTVDIPDERETVARQRAPRAGRLIDGKFDFKSRVYRYSGRGYTRIYDDGAFCDRPPSQANRLRKESPILTVRARTRGFKGARQQQAGSPAWLGKGSGSKLITA